MSSPKTTPNKASVKGFLDAVEDPARRRECRDLSALMRAATGRRARMWGTSIVGFGKYRYRYASGREGEWPIVGFSPRKRNLSIYIMPGFARYGALLKRLGKHKMGKSCLYLTRLDDVDRDVLRELIERAVADIRARHETD